MSRVEEIAQELERVRMTARMSRRQVAEAVGVTEKTIYTWEKAKAMPTLDKAVELASIYKTSISDLVGEEIVDDLHMRIERIEAALGIKDEELGN